MIAARLQRIHQPGARLPVAALIAAPAIALAGLAAAPVAAQQAAGEDATVMIDGLLWAVSSNGEDVPWEQANEYCETLELDGHSDWRLPTLEEIEGLYDPSAEDNGFIMSPIDLGGCCLWSSTSLEDLSAEEVGVRSDQRDDPAGYHWGFLYAEGIRYYSVDFFPDGQAQCVRDPDED